MICRRAGMRNRLLTGVLSLTAASTYAAEPLATNDASALLQRMSEAARNVTYEGVFVMQHGGNMQTLAIANRPSGSAKDSRLAALDGIEREIRCSQTGSISRITEGGTTKLEKRLNSRYFPDLLPPNAANLAAWYGVKLGDRARVAGLECQQVQILPKDGFRWGYVLCADKTTGLPLKAMMVDESGKPLMQYAFAEIHIGNLTKPNSKSELKAQQNAAFMPPPIDASRPVTQASITVNNLPPGFARISAVKRKLPNKSGEVEHWVFSDA